MPDWREAARERYCGILLDRLETATTFEEREAISGRIEWLLGVPGAEDPDERALAVTVTRREIEIPDLLAWRRAFEAQHAAGVPVADGSVEAADAKP